MSEAEPGVGLRPMEPSDLRLLPGGDSPYDEWDGTRPSRTEPPGPDLTENGGLVVVDGTSGEVLGDVSWRWVTWGPNPQSSNPMIGIWLRREARGRGVGAAAQRALVARFFEQAGVHRVEAGTDVENVAERRSLEKVGFTLEGVVRRAQWRGGAFHDCAIYSILRSEWAG